MMTKLKRNLFNSLPLTIVLVLLCLTGCQYDDFVENEFDYTAVYFPKANIPRTFIMGEGMRIGVGAVLGGRLKNNTNVEITYSLDDAAAVDAGFEVLPDDLYSLVDEDGEPISSITIPAGKVQGFVYVAADSTQYLADSLALGNNYALGFKMETVKGADSILANNSQTVISFSYVNRLYGFYVQKGSFESVDEDGTTETAEYAAAIDNPVELTMAAPDTVFMNGLGEFRSAPQGNPQPLAKLSIASDNTIKVVSVPGEIPVVDNGGSFYDPEAREVHVNYSFSLNGVTYNAKDVLLLRNRVIDGVNLPNYDYE